MSNEEMDDDELELRKEHLGHVTSALRSLHSAELLRESAQKTGVYLLPLSEDVVVLLDALRADIEAQIPAPLPHDPSSMEVHFKGALPETWSVLREMTKEEAATALWVKGETPEGVELFEGPGLIVLGGFIRGERPVFKNEKNKILPYPDAKAIYRAPAGNYLLVQYGSKA